MFTFADLQLSKNIHLVKTHQADLCFKILRKFTRLQSDIICPQINRYENS